MLNSVALDVVFGLIFIYLLYSLLATVLSEMIASLLGLRARNLKVAINRMLNDDQVRTWAQRLLDSLRIMKSPDNKVINRFYGNPEIRYLGGSGLFTKPSFIKPGSFARALIGELAGNGPAPAVERITATLRQSASNPANPAAGDKKHGFLDHESGSYLLKLWEEAGADIDKFRLLLEDWFDRTMEQASEWYKRKIQAVLLVLGFCMAWFFCADTFIMVKTLSNDRHAREQMVTLASAKVQAKPDTYDHSMPETWKKLEADITNANSVLGLGGWLPHSVMVMTHPVTREKSFEPNVDVNSLSLIHQEVINGPIEFSFTDKLAYLFRLAFNHFFGFMITAVAISLGAPFWFDLLNKVMKLRTSPGNKPAKA
jgi:hypothetical protein